MSNNLMEFIKHNDLKGAIGYIKRENEKNPNLWKVEMFLIKAIEKK
ncbi:MAG: hypothetical protein GY861_17195 [bacterium]|nr:hypothetical protein [bacterium]